MASRLAFLAFPSLIFLGCFSDQVASPPADSPEGAASVVIDVGHVGALSKASARIDLVRLRVTLSATGEKDLNDTFNLTGTTPVVFAKTYSGLAADKRWNLTARSFDSRDSVIHMGVTTFLVENRKTAMVKLDLAARYSWMTARFFPIRDSVNRVSLLIDNVARAQESFARQGRLGDTLTLGYDYVETGRRNIKMQAHGVWNGAQTLLYAADTNLAVIAGQDARHFIELRWVGPRAAPIGAASMTVSLGQTGNVVLNGHLKYDHGDGFRYYRISMEDREDEEARKAKKARLKLRTAFFRADGRSYPEEGRFEIVALSAVEAGGDVKDLLKSGKEKKGWIQFKDLDWSLVLDMKERLKFEEAVLEAENFAEFRAKGVIRVESADDLQGPWTACGQMEVGKLVAGEAFKLRY